MIDLDTETENCFPRDQRIDQRLRALVVNVVVTRPVNHEQIAFNWPANVIGELCFHSSG